MIILVKRDTITIDADEYGENGLTYRVIADIKIFMDASKAAFFLAKEWEWERLEPSDDDC